MSARVYKKPEATHIQGLCVKCGVKPQRRNTKTTYKPLCRACDRKRYVRAIVKIKRELLTKNYRKYKSIFCIICGFIPTHSCQLDVHHIDHNHHNNDPNNLQTVCANCHRLIHKDQHKTKITPEAFQPPGFKFVCFSLATLFLLLSVANLQLLCGRCN